MMTDMKKALSVLCLIALLLTMVPALASPNNELDLSDEQLKALELALADENRDVPVDEVFRIKMSAGDDLSIAQGLDEDWLNILILGTDTGSAKINYGRTDAMMILSVNTKTGTTKLTSLVRDMLVDIPGLKVNNRINVANAFGGPYLAIKTVNEVMGLNITRYCTVNFRGFAAIVDYLGGVELTLSGAEAGEANVPQSNGPQPLNGEQALAYVRIRKLDNNFGRNERQRKLLSSLLNKVKHSSMDKVLGAVTETFKTISTNLTTAEVISLLPAVLRNAEQLHMLSLPAAGSYQYETTSWGASVVRFDEEATRATFHNFVYQDIVASAN